VCRVWSTLQVGGGKVKSIERQVLEGSEHPAAAGKSVDEKPAGGASVRQPRAGLAPSLP